MRIVVAPAAFKGTVSAVDAAQAIAEGAAEALPDAEVITCPIADGGDGTLEVLVAALQGDLVQAVAMGPLGRPVSAFYGWLPGEVAVVELALTSGLALLGPGERDPLGATTRGTGDLMAAALERRPRRMVVGVGGSATSDGGAGAAEALGVSMVDGAGAAIGGGARGLLSLEKIELSSLNPALRAVELTVACDVRNPLLGPQGAARVFAPQKRATTDEVAIIERALKRFAEVVEKDIGVSIAELPGAGAAGGAAGGMHALLGAELRDGFDEVAEIVGFDQCLENADLLIVGEGSLDEQSLMGKAPIAAARRARAAGIPVWGFAGRVEVPGEKLLSEGIEVWADLSALAGAQAQSQAPATLRKVAARMLSRSFG